MGFNARETPRRRQTVYGFSKSAQEFDKRRNCLTTPVHAVKVSPVEDEEHGQDAGKDGDTQDEILGKHRRDERVEQVGHTGMQQNIQG